jgi:apolipoprotein N-acyltransferase
MHTQMAAVRAIEGGFSIPRSTRMGLSAGIDAHGRMRGWLSANESAENILLVSLPAHRVQTVYSVLGDWTVLPFAAVLVYALLRVRCGLRARPVLRAVS